jgi:hypothetical protein
METDPGVVTDGGGVNTLTLDEWLEMDLKERIALIRKGRVQFLRDGQPTGAKEALAAIKSGLNVGVKIREQS